MRMIELSTRMTFGQHLRPLPQFERERSPASPLCAKQFSILPSLPAWSTSGKVDALAKRELLRMAAAFCVNTAAIHFLAGPMSLVPISMAALNVALVATLVSAVGLAAMHVYRGHASPHASAWEALYPTLASYGKNFSHLSLLNFIGLGAPNFLIHELGHFLAAFALFKNPKASLRIVPFTKGSTEYVVSNGLTRLGSLFGKDKAILLITAAGTTASLLFAMGEFAASHFCKDSHPQLSKGLELHGVSQLLNEVVYGCWSLLHIWANPVGGARPSKNLFADDFYALWARGGIHPLAILAVLIALPLIERRILDGYFPGKV